MASLLKLMSSNVLSTVNRGLIPQVTSITNNQIACVANMSKFNKIVNKLGIPEPPKKPSTGYIRFSQEVRNSLNAPGKSLIENTALIALQWKKLSDEQKGKYNREFKKEHAEYRKHYLEYVSKLTPEQKNAIKAERKLLKENQEQAAKKKVLKEEQKALGKPRKSSAAFTLFLSDQRKNSNTKIADMKDNWSKLPDAQKQAYKQKAKQLYDVYEVELKKWEDKMMTEGKGHLVRKVRFLKKNTEEKRAKKSKTE